MKKPLILTFKLFQFFFLHELQKSLESITIPFRRVYLSIKTITYN